MYLRGAVLPSALKVEFALSPLDNGYRETVSLRYTVVKFERASVLKF